MPGDIQFLNSILTGDCLDLLPQIPDTSIPFTLFSPPYDQIRDYQKNWSLDFGRLGEELYRVSTDGAIVAMVINDGTRDFAKSLTTARVQVDWVDRVGFRLFENVIYARNGSPGAWWNSRFRVDHEYILLFLKGSRPRQFDKSHLAVPAKQPGREWHGTTRLTSGGFEKIQGGRVSADTKCRGTIWHYQASNTEKKTVKHWHPATFPDDLASDLIRCFTLPGDMVLDPFAGSGTTCVQAQKLGRNFIGMEIAPDYVSIAQQLLGVA